MSQAISNEAAKEDDMQYGSVGMTKDELDEK